MQQEESIRHICKFLNSSSEMASLREDLNRLSEEEWEELIHTAAAGGMSPFLYYRMKEKELLTHIPESIQSRLKDHFLNATAHNMRIFHQAGPILAAFRDHQVDVIVLKGLYLAENIYPSIGLRTFGDLDLLVHRDDLERGLQVLQALGYKLSTYFDPLDPNRDIKHLPPLFKIGSPVIELHWTILAEDEPFVIPPADLWSRALQTNVAGVDVFTLDPEDLILHLCIHSSYQHEFRNGIKPLYDIALVIEKHHVQVNWEKLATTSRSWGAERVVWLTLHLVHEITAVEIPDSFLQSLLNEKADSAILEKAKQQLYFLDETAASLSPNLGVLQTLKTPIARIRRILKQIFLSRRAMAIQYNLDPRSWKVYYFYCVRFVNLLRSYGWFAWGVLRNQKKAMEGFNWGGTSAHLKEWMGARNL